MNSLVFPRWLHQPVSGRRNRHLGCNQSPVRATYSGRSTVARNLTMGNKLTLRPALGRLSRLFGALKGQSFYRHRAPVRVTHWINALAILFLLGSGLNIFNAHSRLYWGKVGADTDHPL